MTEEHELEGWKMIAIGAIGIVIFGMSQFHLLSSTFVNPPQSVLDFEAETGFVGFMVGNLCIAYGCLNYMVQHTKPKTPKWDAKLEVQKYLEKKN